MEAIGPTTAINRGNIGPLPIPYLEDGSADANLTVEGGEYRKKESETRIEIKGKITELVLKICVRQWL